MITLTVIIACTVLVNALWLAALFGWPERMKLEYTILVSILLTSLATIMSGWMLVDVSI